MFIKVNQKVRHLGEEKVEMFIIELQTDEFPTWHLNKISSMTTSCLIPWIAPREAFQVVWAIRKAYDEKGKTWAKVRLVCASVRWRNACESQSWKFNNRALLWQALLNCPCDGINTRTFVFFITGFVCAHWKPTSSAAPVVQMKSSHSGASTWVGSTGNLTVLSQCETPTSASGNRWSPF